MAKKNPHDVLAERPLPHSLDAEKAVLGAILLDNSYLDLLAENLRPDEFFLDQNRKLYDRICAMRAANKVVDGLTLVDELSRAGELDACGGVGYISSLGDGVPVVTNVDHYAKIVRDKAALRSMVHLGNSMMQRAMDGEDSATLLASVETVLDSIDIQWGEEDGVTLRQAAVRCLENFEKGKGIRAFSGIAELDELTGGMREGEVWIISAKTGTGKTILANQIMRHTCKAKMHGLYCSGEMFAHHLIARGLATDAAVEHYKMRVPEKLVPEDWAALGVAASKQCDTCSILDGELSVGRIRAAAKRKKRKGALHLVVIDYDELVDAPGATDLERQIAVCRMAKRIALLQAVPVIMVSQLNKTMKDGEMITLERLYGSGKKTKDATGVLYFERKYLDKWEGDEAEAKLLILKNRDGRTGFVNARFNIKTLQVDGNPTWGSTRNVEIVRPAAPQAQQSHFNESPETVGDNSPHDTIADESRPTLSPIEQGDDGDADA